MTKKKILTEDTFNASGSTHVDETILNENANTELTNNNTDEDEKITSEDVITKDDINNNVDMINITNNESNSKKPAIEDDTKNSDIEDDNESTKDDIIKDEKIVENDNKVLEPSISVNVSSKETLTKYEYGFNDEAAYIK